MTYVFVFIIGLVLGIMITHVVLQPPPDDLDDWTDSAVQTELETESDDAQIDPPDPNRHRSYFDTPPMVVREYCHPTKNETVYVWTAGGQFYSRDFKDTSITKAGAFENPQYYTVSRAEALDLCDEYNYNHRLDGRIVTDQTS